MQIPPDEPTGYSLFIRVLFRDNRGLRFSVRRTSVDALFYFKGETMDSELKKEIISDILAQIGSRS